MGTMKKTPIVLVSCAFLLAALAVFLFFVYESVKDLESQRAAILQRAKTALNRDIRYDQAAFSVATGPAFTFTGVVIMDREGDVPFVSAERMVLRIAILPLLTKEWVIKEVRLVQPRIVIRRDASGNWNMGDILEAKMDEPVQVRGVTIEGGRLVFQDLFVRKEGVSATLEDLSLRLRNMAPGRKTSVNFQTAVSQGGKKGQIEIAGAILLPGKEKPWLDTALDLNLRARQIDLAAYGPYYLPSSGFTHLAGDLDCDAVVKGNWSEFASSGTVTLRKVDFLYSRVFPKALAPKEIHLDYEMQRSERQVALKRLNISVDDFRSQGFVTLRDLGTQDPMIEAQVKTSVFSFEKIHPYIPFGILPKNVAAYVREHVRAGDFRLLEGSLVGRLSQIRHMDQGNNADVLQARMSVEKGQLFYGEKVPLFRNIKGELFFRGRDFLLHGMSGYFGDSALTLDGAIRNYCLDMPSTYPFRLTMKPGPRETAWLLGAEAMKKVKIAGNSTLMLSGEGLLDDYKLTGEWDLTPLHYTYGPLTKPVGRANRLRFITDVREGELRIGRFQYDLAPISLFGSAHFRLKGRGQAAVAVESNDFDLRDVGPIWPAMKKYQAAGQVRFQWRRESRPQHRGGGSWRGSVALGDVSFKPREGLKALQNIRGVIQAANDGANTSGLSFNLGSSTLFLQGSLKDFNHPQAEAVFSSNLLDAADLGLVNPRGPVRLQDLKGRVVLKETVLQIPFLSARLNSSNFNISLSWPRRNETLPIDFRVTAPVLEQADLMLLLGLEREPREENPNIRSYRGDISIGRGTIENFPYTNLRADIFYRDPSIVIARFDFKAQGGAFSGTGKVDVADKKRPVYEMTFRMENVAAESLLQMTEINKEMVSGMASAKGNFTASGVSKNDFKQTFRGIMEVQIDKGVLKKFTVLSKVFSILNVSQLLTFSLPDMVSEGMPFTKITADLSIRDGLLVTKNAFLKSEAMNMIAAGNIDLLKETMDMSIGLQPLQTVDKVVSRIPVLGWILTDKDKRLITVYFEAKGPWKDPIVRAVPVRELAKEVLNIFKRVLELPVKLVTDTGEVFIP